MPRARSATPNASEEAGHRGVKRAPDGDPIEKVTVTLPASVVRALDELVFWKKNSVRSFNRSALIQEAIAAYLPAARERNRS